MKRVFAIIWIGILSGCGNQPPAAVFLADPQEIQQTTTVSNPQTSAPFNKPLDLHKDLGVVLTGTKHDVEFVITNPGNTDWIFHDMLKVCRCVVAEPIPKVIPKKGEVKIRMTIDAGNEAGDYARFILLNYTNRPGPIKLNVKMRIRTPLYLASRQLRFSPSSPGQQIRATTRVENWSEAKWESLEVKPSVEWIQATIVPLAFSSLENTTPGLRMQQMWDLTVTANPPTEVTGSIVQSIAIRAVGSDEVRTIPVTGERPHPIVSQPHALIISGRVQTDAASSSGRKLVATLSVPATSPAKRFQILSTTGTRLEGCEITWEQISETEARVEVIIPPTQTGGISGFVVVKFADGLPDLAIPVAGGV